MQPKPESQARGAARNDLSPTHTPQGSLSHTPYPPNCTLVFTQCSRERRLEHSVNTFPVPGTPMTPFQESQTRKYLKMLRVRVFTGGVTPTGYPPVTLPNTKSLVIKDLAPCTLVFTGCSRG